MRLLFVNTYFAGGGAEKVMRQLYYGTRNEHIETYCIVGRWQKDVPDEVQIIYKDFIGRSVTTLAGGCLNNTLLKTRRAKAEIIKCVKENKIDIIHFHNLHSNYIGLSDLDDIRKYCKAVVVTLHDMWLLTGGCAYSFDCDKWVSDVKCYHCKGNVSMHRGKRYASKLLQCKIEHFQHKNINFVTPSKWLHQYCKESYLAEERIQCIHNGISLNHFQNHDKKMMKKKYSLPENKHILLFVANKVDSVYKGFPYLLDALLRLSDKEKYALLIVGNMNKDIVSMPYDIYSMGYVRDEATLSEIYAAADLFILPSVADVSSFTAMEAMASGTPVLAFDTGGIPEIVSDDVGWCVPPRDSEALADMIRNIFLKPKELEIKTSLCRSRIEKNFSETRMLDEYIKLYERLCEEESFE